MTTKERAKIGDTIRTISGREFVVLNEETDNDGVQWVYQISEQESDERGDGGIFAWDSYGVPDSNFIIINRT